MMSMQFREFNMLLTIKRNIRSVLFETLSDFVSISCLSDVKEYFKRKIDINNKRLFNQIQNLLISNILLP